MQQHCDKFQVCCFFFFFGPLICGESAHAGVFACICIVSINYNNHDTMKLNKVLNLHKPEKKSKLQTASEM